MSAYDAMADLQTKYWRLRRSELFDCLSDAAVKALGQLCEIRVVPRGSLLYGVGEPCDRLFVLESGSIKLLRVAEDGREVNVAVLGQMEIFGEGGLTGESVRTDTAIALEEAVVCAFDSMEFELFLKQHPEMSLRITKLIGDRLRRVESRIQDILFKDVRTRLAHTVARLADRFGEDVPGGMRIGLRLTQTDLAQLIGSTRETTSTIFNELRRDGFVENDGYHIIVLDRDALSGF